MSSVPASSRKTELVQRTSVLLGVCIEEKPEAADEGTNKGKQGRSRENQKITRGKSQIKREKQ